ncbi:hypothetical protein AXG93_2337s1020 [Marchantia polymorpha subsp. ruderalis]|uniref:Uncharacterized protein n=1 Tax=Marchantia polymorpha subsp. ruderalis TaxID=1480154 RepID=A0A176WKV3_MARPO|nr:hypothetical protein AXG93_2337s1020 [Marchantia polymorpha subsp. ruderalis]
MVVLAHLYTNHVEVAYMEAVALKRQEELIREDEAVVQVETELQAKQETIEKEKRSKKKQAKRRCKDLAAKANGLLRGVRPLDESSGEEPDLPSIVAAKANDLLRGVRSLDESSGEGPNHACKD